MDFTLKIQREYAPLGIPPLPKIRDSALPISTHGDLKNGVLLCHLFYDVLLKLSLKV